MNQEKEINQFDAIAENEHKEKMRAFSLLQNLVLLIVFLVCFCISPKWWLLSLFALYDFSIRRRERKYEEEIIVVDETPAPSAN